MAVELIRPFEEELVERFGSIGKMVHPKTGERGWKGIWIRGHLLDVKTDYVYSMYLTWRDVFCLYAEGTGVRINPGTYQAFRTYFYLLKQLGLVRVYLKMSKKPGDRGLPKVHYEVVPERIDDPAWTRPFQTRYPATDWTIKSATEKRELREKYPRRRKRL